MYRIIIIFWHAWYLTGGESMQVCRKWGLVIVCIHFPCQCLLLIKVTNSMNTCLISWISSVYAATDFSFDDLDSPLFITNSCHVILQCYEELMHVSLFAAEPSSAESVSGPDASPGWDARRTHAPRLLSSKCSTFTVSPDSWNHAKHKYHASASHSPSMKKMGALWWMISKVIPLWCNFILIITSSAFMIYSMLSKSWYLI